MKYQALKQLKTKIKLLKMCDTLAEAHRTIQEAGGIFHSFSYVGGFPVYFKGGTQPFSIQGYYEPMGVVCSIPQKELDDFIFRDDLPL